MTLESFQSKLSTAITPAKISNFIHDFWNVVDFMMLATFFTSYSLKWISHIKVNNGREEWENLEFIGSGSLNGLHSRNKQFLHTICSISEKIETFQAQERFI